MQKKTVFTAAALAIAAVFIICVAAIGLKNGVFGLFGGEADGNAAAYEYTWDTAEREIYGVDIEWINGDVEITVGEGELVHITETSGKALNDSEKLLISRDDGILKIKWKDELITFGIFQNKNKNITVEIPESLAKSMEELTCTTTSGKITAAGFTAKKMNFSSTSGSLALENLSGEIGKLATVSGDIELKGASFSEKLFAESTSGKVKFDEVKTAEAEFDTTSGGVEFIGVCDEIFAETVSGAVRAELSAVPMNAEMKAVSGSLTLVIPENKGFDAEFNSISGIFETDFDVSGISGAKSGRALYAGGDCTFKFETTSGGMRVLKK